MLKFGSSAMSGGVPLIVPARRKVDEGPTVIVVAIGPPGAWVMLYRCQTTGCDGIVTASLTSNFEPGRVEMPAGPMSMRDEIGCSRWASANPGVIPSAARKLHVQIPRVARDDNPLV